MATPHPQSDLQLVVVCGEAVSVHPLRPNTTLTLGRAEDSQVRVDDAAVSRKHAVIHVGPPLEIQDLGGANGTLIRSGTPADVDPTSTAALRNVRGRRSLLAVGDAIVMGAAVAVVRHAPPEVQLSGGDVVADDPAMKALYAQATRAAQAVLPVLILGETGVGKDVLARSIHRASPRVKGPFLALNCAALSETLLEGELFGHTKGSFTGAIAARAGLIESAEGGTVFLDEVGELPRSTQVKLLRVLEQREVMRIGERTARTIDVRFIAATNRDLEAASTDGSFRQDLFFRLNGISLTVPPLRERPGDIRNLAHRLLVVACQQVDRTAIPAISPAALTAMEAYAWPGNVRELRHAIERALVLVEGSVILNEHLPPRVAASVRAHGPTPSRSPAPSHPSLPSPDPHVDPRERGRQEWKAADRLRVLDALARCDGNQTRAADILGISRRTLIYRLEEYGIDRPRKVP